MRVSDAAMEAFRLWVASKRQDRVRDQVRMLNAAKDIDALREEHKIQWSGSEEIRKWWDERNRS